MLGQCGDVQAFIVVHSAVPLHQRDNFETGGGHEFRGHAADVAESLDHDASSLAIEPEAAQRLIRDNHTTPACGFGASARAAQIDGFACNDSGLRVPATHGVGVHDPGHGLVVGVYVRRGDVDFRADEFVNLRGVAA